MSPNAPDNTSRREVSIALGCTLLAAVCFGGIPAFLRHLRLYLDPWTVNAVRYSTAALFWLPFVLVMSRRGKAAHPAGKRSIWVAALVPTAFNLAGQVGWAWCPYYAKAATVGFGVRASFLFTIVFGLLIIPAERVLARRPLFIFGAVASLGGILLMYLQALAAGVEVAETAAADGGAVGMAIILGTAVFWGGYSVAVRHCLAGYPLRLAFGVICLYTAACLIALMLLFGDYGRLAELPVAQWGMMLFSAMSGIAFGHVLLYRGIHGLGPVTTSGITMVYPFVTFAVAAVFLGESLTGVQWLGGLAIVAGGLMLVKAKAQVLGGESTGVLPPPPD